jgi:hypothetical protein
VICIVHHCPLFCFLLPIYLAHITDDTPDRDVYYATIQNSTLNLSLRNSFFFLRPKKTRGKGQVEVSPDTQSSRSSMANKPERERERVCVGAKEGNKTPRECARFWATNASVRSSGNSSFQAPPCPATSFLRLPAASPFAFSPVMFLLFFRCALCCGSGG